MQKRPAPSRSTAADCSVIVLCALALIVALLWAPIVQSV